MRWPSIRVDVVLGRRRHPLEGVEQIQLPIGRPEPPELHGRCHHTAATPDPALDEVSRYFALDDVAHGVENRQHPGSRRHGVVAHRLPDSFRFSILRAGGRLVVAPDIDAYSVGNGPNAANQ